MAPERPDQDLKRFADEHLLYEITMLHAVCDTLTGRTGQTLDDICQNALLESFTIHARALLDFFGYGRSPRPDDAHVTHFVDGWQAPELEGSSDVRSRVGKEIAHLTYARSDRSPDTKGWPIDAIARDVAILVCQLVLQARETALSYEFGRAAMDASNRLLKAFSPATERQRRAK